MSRRFATVVLATMAGMRPSLLPAQNVTVQQPAFGVNSVATTVSVPDGGGIYLGGVGRGAASRGQYGPLRSGYGIGTAYEASASSAHVFIHDLRAMDEAILRSAPARHDGTRLGTGAEHAYRSLLARDAAQTAAGPTRSGTTRAGTGDLRAGAERAARSYHLGLDAERRGATNVARLHFEAAARAGSSAAEAKLAASGRPELAERPVATSDRNGLSRSNVGRP